MRNADNIKPDVSCFKRQAREDIWKVANIKNSVARYRSAHAWDLLMSARNHPASPGVADNEIVHTAPRCFNGSSELDVPQEMGISLSPAVHDVQPPAGYEECRHWELLELPIPCRYVTDTLERCSVRCSGLGCTLPLLKGFLDDRKVVICFRLYRELPKPECSQGCLIMGVVVYTTLGYGGGGGRWSRAVIHGRISSVPPDGLSHHSKSRASDLSCIVEKVFFKSPTLARSRKG